MLPPQQNLLLTQASPLPGFLTENPGAMLCSLPYTLWPVHQKCLSVLMLKYVLNLSASLPSTVTILVQPILSFQWPLPLHP